jgi:hypothetical protein
VWGGGYRNSGTRQTFIITIQTLDKDI